MSRQWSQYWQHQTLNSCLPTRDADANVLKKLWGGFCQTLPEKAKGLDIATGNGAVISQIMSLRPDLFWIGVDLAQLNPPDRLKNHANIEFRDQISVESLPFSPGSFDFITSQFGLEYANLSKALSQVSRALKQGGAWQFVMHASNSLIVQSHQCRLTELTGLLKVGGVMEALSELAEQNNTLEQLEEAGRAFLQNEGRQATGVQRQAFSGINQLLERFDRGQDISAYSHSMRQRMEAERARLQELLEAAVTEQRMDQLSDEASGVGLNVQRREKIRTSDGAHIMGWLIQGERL